MDLTWLLCVCVQVQHTVPDRSVCVSIVSVLCEDQEALGVLLATGDSSLPPLSTFSTFYTPFCLCSSWLNLPATPDSSCTSLFFSFRLFCTLGVTLPLPSAGGECCAAPVRCALPVSAQCMAGLCDCLLWGSAGWSCICEHVPFHQRGGQLISHLQHLD